VKNISTQQPRLNAVRHGFLSKEAVLENEKQREFNKLTRQLVAELAPQGILEKMVVEQIIVTYWRLKRFLKLENEVFLLSGKPTLSIDRRDPVAHFVDFVRRNPSFELLSRYNATLLRSFYRSVNELKNLQGSRNKNKIEQNDKPDTL
jgi:translation elongation factor EF-Ts